MTERIHPPDPPFPYVFLYSRLSLRHDSIIPLGGWIDLGLTMQDPLQE